MCKLIALSTAACKSTKQASQLVIQVRTLLAASQRDGFGYALKTSDGVFSERYVNPDSCTGLGSTKASRDILPVTLQTQLVYGVDYDQQGNAPSKGAVQGCMIAHGRTATCDKSVTNTHPFTGYNAGQQWTIAHNGVVDWNGTKLPLHTTCDSEHILNCFLYMNGEQSFKDGLSGYAAVVGINPQGEMFALRDDRAPLYVQYVKELDQYILCTDQTHCEAISKLVIGFNGIKNATVTTPMMLAPYVKHTFHANGDITSVQFGKFSSTSSRISSASIYRSMSSAGAYGRSYGAWDDDYGYSARTVPSVTTPSTPPAAPVVPPAPAASVESTEDTASSASTSPSDVDAWSDEMRAEALDQYRKQQSHNLRRNAYKPWKHKK